MAASSLSDDVRAGGRPQVAGQKDEPVRPGIMLIPTVPRPRPAHTGWTVFAGLMLLLGGLWNVVWGFFEILNDYYFSGNTLLAGNHSLWGWLYIAAGVCLLLLAPLVFAHNPAGVVLATFAVALNPLSHLLGFGHRIGWSIAALVIDGLVLFALINYGFRIRGRRANPLDR
jgi:hypothetical protein